MISRGVGAGVDARAATCSPHEQPPSLTIVRIGLPFSLQRVSRCSSPAGSPSDDLNFREEVLAGEREHRGRQAVPWRPRPSARPRRGSQAHPGRQADASDQPAVSPSARFARAEVGRPARRSHREPSRGRSRSARAVLCSASTSSRRNAERARGAAGGERSHQP